MSSEPQTLLIDIRRDSEVFNKHVDTTGLRSPGVYVIPMNMIRFNRDTILNHLQWVKTIYLVCDTGRRSAYIKAKYFADEPRIKVDPALQFTHLHEGSNTVTLTDGTKLQLPVKTATGIYSITRIIQLFFGSVVAIAAAIGILKLDIKCVVTRYALYVILALAVMMVINGATDTCTLSMLLRDYLN